MSRYRGRLGEDVAARYLIGSGYQILCRNYYSRYGEIDIIAANGQYIVFVEVKARSASPLVGGADSVTPQKQARLSATASIYLQQHATELQPRFDVVELIYQGNRFRVTNYIENAF